MEAGRDKTMFTPINKYNNCGGRWGEGEGRTGDGSIIGLIHSGIY